MIPGAQSRPGATRRARSGRTLRRLAVPADYHLARDACSYGYFLLEPNHWDPAREEYIRVLDLPGPPAGAVRVQLTQPDGPGTPLRVLVRPAVTARGWGQVTGQLARMLRLDEPAEAIAAFHALDPRWRDAGRGRLMRSPTFFEDVIKTITSCNVTWPGTITMNRRLCQVLGRRVPGAPRASPPQRAVSLPRGVGARAARVRAGRAQPSSDTPAQSGVWHAFPSPRRLSRTSPAILRGRCRTGYRDGRIVQIAKLFTRAPRRGGIDAAWFEDPATPDAEVHGALLKLPGVGPYAAANIMQLLGRYARLPLDTESVRHGKAVLGMTGPARSIMRRLAEHFAPFGDQAFRSYWFELWAFYEARRGPSHTWEKHTVGATFTAAKL